MWFTVDVPFMTGLMIIWMRYYTVDGIWGVEVDMSKSEWIPSSCCVRYVGFNER